MMNTIRKQYVIEYKVLLLSDVIKGKIKVKNCLNEIHAKIKLGEYLKEKYPNNINIEMMDISNSLDINDFLKGFG